MTNASALKNIFRYHALFRIENNEIGANKRSITKIIIGSLMVVHVYLTLINVLTLASPWKVMNVLATCFNNDHQRQFFPMLFYTIPHALSAIVALSFDLMLLKKQNNMITAVAPVLISSDNKRDSVVRNLEHCAQYSTVFSYVQYIFLTFSRFHRLSYLTIRQWLSP